MNLRHTARLAVVAVAGWTASFVHASATDLISITSPAFAHMGQIPPRYARTHDNISPPLLIMTAQSGPFQSKSFVLIVDDPDAPGGLFTHWLVWNIDPHSSAIPGGRPPPGATEGTNSFGDAHYDGPQPPNGKHRYFFQIYGLDTMLSLPAGSDRAALEAAMKGHIVAKTEMYGTFSTGQ